MQQVQLRSYTDKIRIVTDRKDRYNTEDLFATSVASVYASVTVL